MHEDDGSSMDTDGSNDEARNDSMSVGNNITATVVDRPQGVTDKLLLYHMKLAERLLLLLAVILVFPWIQSDARV